MTDLSETLFTREQFVGLIIDDATPIATQVAAACCAAGKRAVWVEGFQHSGKSYVAGGVASALGWRAVHLDKLMRADCAGVASYIESLDPARLEEALGTPELRTDVVIEGICLRDVLASRADRKGAFVVYIKAVAEDASCRLRWDDGLSMEDRPPIDWVARSENEYHCRLRPDRDADLVLARIIERALG